MKIFLADTIQRERLYGCSGQNCLESYYSIVFKKGEFIMNNDKLSIFLDSGAFSAWSKGVEINIDEYIKFIKENLEYIDVYANLDVIGDAEATLKNQKYMEEQGLRPLPTYHRNEPMKYLEYYLDHYDYIALGGMVTDASSSVLLDWLDPIFKEYVCGPDGMPKVKIHGFGVTSLNLLIRYPWYSVDSTSWVMTGRFGSVFVPKKRNGRYCYTEIAHKVVISDKGAVGDGKHFRNFSELERKMISEYFHEHGFTEQQLSEDYMARDRLNIQYFLDLQDALPQWPWAFKPTGTRGFGFK